MVSDSLSSPPRGDLLRTAEYFSRLATTYGDGRYYAVRREAVVDAIAGELSAARAVLDLGCGNGNYLADFARVPGRRILVGADLTFGMLKEARDRAPGASGLIRAEASALPLEASSFDVVFCSHVLPFVPDLNATIDEIARCLRADGLLIATLPGDNIVRREIEKLLGVERYAEFARLVFRRNRSNRERSTEPERYRAAFARAGLRFEERRAPFSIKWQDADEWIRIRWFPVMEASDRPAVESVLAEIGQTANSRALELNEPLVVGRKLGLKP
jgi:ubiquinone/menaquinone biosynthesis C-methylase UbiE